MALSSLIEQTTSSQMRATSVLNDPCQSNTSPASTSIIPEERQNFERVSQSPHLVQSEISSNTTPNPASTKFIVEFVDSADASFLRPASSPISDMQPELQRTNDSLAHHLAELSAPSPRRPTMQLSPDIKIVGEIILPLLMKNADLRGAFHSSDFRRVAEHVLTDEICEFINKQMAEAHRQLREARQSGLHHPGITTKMPSPDRLEDGDGNNVDVLVPDPASHQSKRRRIDTPIPSRETADFSQTPSVDIHTIPRIDTQAPLNPSETPSDQSPLGMLPNHVYDSGTPEKAAVPSELPAIQSSPELSPAHVSESGKPETAAVLPSSTPVSIQETSTEANNNFLPQPDPVQSTAASIYTSSSPNDLSLKNQSQDVDLKPPDCTDHADEVLQPVHSHQSSTNGSVIGMPGDESHETQHTKTAQDIVDVPTQPLSQIPGIWGLQLSLGKPGIVDFTLNLDLEKIQKSIPEHRELALHLLCLPLDLLISAANNPSADLSKGWMMLHAWPPQGSLLLEINHGEPHGQTWYPEDMAPGSDPLDITKVVQQGQNRLRCIQLTSLQHVFAVHASTVPIDPESDT
ncbi:hypothetical protein C8R42DRAFT_726589 [Lentinula raphanica]|nr:hypothetical protein C8R42DRAFT_726589 [Lentinula raphanica]